MIKQHPTKEELYKLFRYDNGRLIWIISKASRNGNIKGCVAGTLINQDNYYAVRINGIRYMLHRLIWIYHYGDIPIHKMIDHIDRDKLNNDINNLRLCDKKENFANSPITYLNKTSYRGVSIDGNYFRVNIKIDNVNIYLGGYNDITHAAKTYDWYALRYFNNRMQLNFHDEDYSMDYPPYLIVKNGHAINVIKNLKFPS